MTSKLRAIIHKAEQGGYWAELPGCVTQGENYEELLENLQEALEGCIAAQNEIRQRGEIH